MNDPVQRKNSGILIISLILGHPPYLILMYMILIYTLGFFVCVLYDSEINTNKQTPLLHHKMSSLHKLSSTIEAHYTILFKACMSDINIGLNDHS